MGIFDETFLPGAQRLSVDSRLCRRVDANARQVRMAASLLGKNFNVPFSRRTSRRIDRPSLGQDGATCTEHH
jgi:hypothetical protein